MRRAAIAALCVFLLSFLVVGSATAQTGNAPSRVALVIGNSAYTAAPPLATSVADAGLVAETLRAAGYDVTELANVPAADIGQAMRNFLDKVAGAGPEGVAFFYYAGHGAQSGGENYLVPVDAKIATDEDVAYEAFRLGDLMAELAQLPAAARIVILDAAHDHGFGRGTPRPVPPGLAIMNVPDGMLVALNAAPGAVAPAAEGANSLYTTALVTLMRQPGLDMEQIAKGARLEVNQASAGAQVPWMVSSLGVDLRLFEAAAATPTPEALPPVAAPPAGAAPVGLVRVPPKGERPFSRDYLRGLSPDDAYQVVIEEDTLAGYQWFVELFPQHPFAGQVWDIINSRREAVLWRRTLAQNSRNAYWNYLKRYPDGAHAAEAQGRLEALAAPPAPPPTYVATPEPLPPDYYDEAVGLADMVPQGFAPPPPVFDDTPPFFFLPPPPRPPRPPIIIVRPPPPVIIVDRRRPPDIVVRPPRPPRPDGFRPGDGRRPPDGMRTPVATPVTPSPVGPRPTDGRRPRDGIRIQGGGPVVRPTTPGSTPSPVRPTTPAPSGVMSTPSAQPVRPVTPGVGLPSGGRPTTPGVGLPPGGRPGLGPTPGQAVAPQGAPVGAQTPGSRPGMPMGPGGRPTIQGVTQGRPPGVPAGTPVQGARPGLPQPPTASPTTVQPPRPPTPPTSAPMTAQPPRPGVPPTPGPATAQPPRPGIPPVPGPSVVQPPRPPTPPTAAPVTAQPPRPGMPPTPGPATAQPPRPTPPVAQPPRPQPPVAQPPRPQPQPPRPTAQPPRPQPQPVRPVAQPPRPQPQPVRPVAQPPRPQPQPVRPVAQPPRPQPQPVRPGAQPPRPPPPRAAPPPPRPVAAPPRPAAPPPRAAPPPPRPAAAPSCPPGTRNVGGRCTR
jgi:hypothetical protein